MSLIYLLLLSTENQFIAYRVPVKQYLKQGANELVITFSSAFLKVSQFNISSTSDRHPIRGGNWRKPTGSSTSGTVILVACMYARHSTSRPRSRSYPEGY